MDIFIGTKKSIANYVVAASRFLQKERKIALRARGRAITRAVDVAEIVRRELVKNAKVKSITLGSDLVEDPKTHRERHISTITIVLAIE